MTTDQTYASERAKRERDAVLEATAKQQVENEGCALSALCCVLLPVRMFLMGFVLRAYWSWFVIPVFGLRSISIAEALGLSAVIHLAFGQVGAPAKADDDRSFKYRLMMLLSVGLSTPLLSLLYGWVLSFFVGHGR